MADLFVALSVNAPDDPKILEAGDHAELVYYRALCLAKRRMSDGIIARSQLRLLGADDDDVAALARVGLWSEVEGGWQIVAWLKHNESKADIEARREAWKLRKAAERDAKKAPSAETVESVRADNDETRDDSGDSHSDRVSDRDSEVSCSEVSVRADTTSCPDGLIEAALDHFERTMGARFDENEIRSAIQLARTRGYDDSEIRPAIEVATWPTTDLERALPVRKRQQPDPPRPTVAAVDRCTDCGSTTDICTCDGRLLVNRPREKGETLEEWIERTGTDA